jgi:hypothetical protein
METMAGREPRRRRSFTPEFKAENVALVRQPAAPLAAWPGTWTSPRRPCGSGSSRPSATRAHGLTG